MQYLILAREKGAADALGCWLSMLNGEIWSSSPSEDSRCLIWKSGNPGDTERGIIAYENIVRWIERMSASDARYRAFGDMVILVDRVNPSFLNATLDITNEIYPEAEWGNLLAMLILSFPEIHWVFGVLTQQLSEDEEWASLHTLSSYLSWPRRNSVFDPTGLVQWVKKTTKQGLPIRSERAAAIDEEIQYSFFHAYTAYRFGFRADTVTSWALMEKLFNGANNSHGFYLLLEDVNLFFPDRPEDHHLSSFMGDGKSSFGRDKFCSKLGYGDDNHNIHQSTSGIESSAFRIIVTGGHSGTGNDPKKNQEYVKRHKPNGWGLVLKPGGGMFDLWTKARLFDRLQSKSSGGEGGGRVGQAPGYVWPPPRTKGKQSGADTAHSAPGKLMLVASHLVRRADDLRVDANSVEECIRGALLATEALELLGYRTPSLALQALELKQWFEVKAEVAFVGVGHHFELEGRFKEIERETLVAARFHSPGLREVAALDAAVTIANRLTLVFRDAGQFDEEEECLRKLRLWNRKLSFRRARNKIHLWPGLGLLAYAEWLISSLGWLLASVTGWMILIALAWWALQPADKLFADAVEGVVSSFIGSGVETDSGTPIILLSVFSAFLGFFHLGVFVSFLYSAIARK